MRFLELNVDNIRVFRIENAQLLGTACIIGLVLTISCFLCCACKKRTRNQPRDNVPAAASLHLTLEDNETQVFTLKDLVIATQSLNASNVIGEGGFGLVYRGVLVDGRLAAIKALDQGGKKGEREFLTEMGFMKRLSSPFVLNSYGYYVDKNYKFLVYEYMPNGNLTENLHVKGIDWSTRIKVSLDAARGLAYLHEQSPPVIHMDFKTSNILLDANFNAKISDFGHARAVSGEDNRHVTTEIIGTKGYVAPEYISTGSLTPRSDVYSFGVVLLELITGRTPVDLKRPAGEEILVTWALPKLLSRTKLDELVDPRLEGQFSTSDMIQVTAIATMCLQDNPQYRPRMSDIVQSLALICKMYKFSDVSGSAFTMA